MAAAQRTPLRIYQARGADLGPVLDESGQLAAAWRSLIEKAASLGFGQVLVEADRAEDPRAASALVRAAARRRLALYLDCGKLGGATAQAGSDVLDPRAMRPVTTGESATTVDWAARAAAWRELGIGGLLLRGLENVPPDALRSQLGQVSDAAAGLDLLAWTPGLSRAAVRSLKGLGFSYVFSSFAWWDFRSAWLMDERYALEEVGSVLAFPVDPYRPGAVGVGVPDPQVRRRAAVRALWGAVATGAGWLAPMGFERYGLDGAPHDQLDLTEDVKAANRWLASASTDGLELVQLAGAGPGWTAALLRRTFSPRGKRLHLLLFNANLLAHAEVDWAALQARLPDGAQRVLRARGAGHPSLPASLPVRLEPGAAAILEMGSAPPVLGGAPRRRSLTAALAAPRVAIEAVSPVIEGGRFAVKRTPGEALRVQADIFMDGHDKLAADLLWRAADESSWTRIPMRLVDNDRWEAMCRPERIGMGWFAIEAWRDTFSTYVDELGKKSAAGLDVSVEVDEARDWVMNVLSAPGTDRQDDVRARAGEAAQRLPGLSTEDCLQWLQSPEAAALMRALDPREFASRSPEFPVRVERRVAQFGSWYELFPRSQSGDPGRHGTFDDVIVRLPAIREMGFDVLYFPPIHPIGRKNRKGRNNGLVAGPGDPGSPYAIGSEEGGHDAIHPELGTLDDFRRLVDEAARHGLEIALDFAVQCSPDHPWLREHPEWFAWRSDGSLRYAENPPKKYEDIVNVDFYARPGGRDAASGLWLALLDVVLFWVGQGVRIFRVDNPHTKPLPFWEWLISQVHARHPDVVFLSEAFTRPKMMYRLAKLGFSQSYTYFTWRETKAELTSYLEEISRPPVSDFFRPNFFVNTPDINPRHLHDSGRPGFLIRAALATTMAGSWGMYNGFELCEATPVPGKEEYLDSEKYEIRAWDWDRPGNIVAEIGMLNRIRRDNPALHCHTGIAFLRTDHDQVLAYTRFTPERDNVVLVVVNLDPHGAHGAHVELPLWDFGLPDDGVLGVEDLLYGHRFDWHGKMQYVYLEPDAPYRVWRIARRF